MQQITIFNGHYELNLLSSTHCYSKLMNMMIVHCIWYGQRRFRLSYDVLASYITEMNFLSYVQSVAKYWSESFDCALVVISVRSDK